MPRLDLKTCRACHRHADDVGPLSHTRLCGDCGPRRMAANADALRDHKGLFWDHYVRRSYLAAVERVLALPDGEA